MPTPKRSPLTTIEILVRIDENKAAGALQRLKVTFEFEAERALTMAEREGLMAAVDDAGRRFLEKMTP